MGLQLKYLLQGCQMSARFHLSMEDKSSTNNMHKKEKKTRISHDQIDRDILLKKMEVSIDIFDASQHEAS